MKVYQVWDWDPYASNGGDEYLAGTYRSKNTAEKRRDKLNRLARAHWMANCSPEGAANYRDRAHIKEVTVK